MRLSVAVVVVVSALLLSADALSAAFGTSSSFDDIFTAQNFSGAVAGRTSPTDVVYRKAFGYLDWQYNVEMLTRARFPIASNTKLYVAVSLYQLQEQGKVNLSRPVADYLDQTDFSNFGIQNVSHYCPQVAGNSTCQRITFVQLMAMTAGIANEGLQFLPFPGSLGLVVGRYIMSPLLFVPGSRYYYSNPSFMLSAYFIEKFSGKSFEQYLHDHIFSIIGLEDTKYDQQDEMFEYDPLRISEYSRYIDPTTKQSVSTGKCTSELQLGSANGAGGIVSTIDDQAKWYFTLFNFSGNVGGGLISAESVYEIIKARTPIGGNEYYGQGLFINTNNASSRLPDQIVYEGMIKCSWTANVYDLTKSPIVMTQAWTNTPVYYVTREQVNSARNSQYGSFWSLTQSWPQAVSATTLAMNLVTAIRNML